MRFSFLLFIVMLMPAAFAGVPFQQWIRYLGQSDSYGRGIATDSSNNVLLAGYNTYTGDLWLLEWNSSGSQLHSKTVSGSRGFGVAVDSNDNIILVGAQVSPSSDVLVYKYSPDFTLLWSRLYDVGSTTEFCDKVAVDSNDNIVCVGYNVTGSNYDFLMLKYDPSGTLSWVQSYSTAPGANKDIGKYIAVDSSDNVIVVGYSEDGSGDRDGVLAKYDSSGNLLWNVTYDGGAGNDAFLGVTVDSSDNIYAVGYTYTTTTSSTDFLVAKYSSSGTLLWADSFEGNFPGQSNSFSSCKLAESETVLLTAGSNNNGADNDAVIYKYDLFLRAPVWNISYKAAASTNDVFTDISVDSSGAFAVSGYANPSGKYEALAARYIEDNAPVVSLNSPESNTYTSSSSVLFNFTVTDDYSSTLACDLYVDGSFNASNSSVSADTPTLFNVTGFSEGNHSWRVNCSDDRGSVSYSNTRYVVVDQTPPSQVTIFSPAPGATVTEPDVNVSFEVIDNLSYNMSCVLYVDGFANASNSSVLNSTQTVLTATGLSSGLHYYNVTCTDLACNVKSSANRSLTVSVGGGSSSSSMVTVVSAPGFSIQDVFVLFFVCTVAFAGLLQRRYSD